MTFISLQIDQALFQALVTSTSIVAAKYIATNLYSLIPSLLTGSGVPEDSVVFTKLGLPEQTYGISAAAADSSSPSKTDGEKSPLTSSSRKSSDAAAARAMYRARRVVGNDVENIPLSLLVMWTAALVASTTENAAAVSELIVLAKVFWVARVAHSIIYYMQIPVLRTLAFMVGTYATFNWPGTGFRRLARSR